MRAVREKRVPSGTREGVVTPGVALPREELREGTMRPLAGLFSLLAEAITGGYCRRMTG